MHTPNLSMRLQLQRYLLSCKVRCRRATHFLESRTCRLAQAVYGKCSLVLPSRCNLSIVCLTLVRTIAVVALTRPPCHRLRRSPKSSRSTAHANVACARWLQGRRGALEAARQSLGALENGVAILGKTKEHLPYTACATSSAPTTHEFAAKAAAVYFAKHRRESSTRLCGRQVLLSKK
jgi:hypothetical protein